MQSYNSLQLQSVAEYAATARNEADVIAAIAWARQCELGLSVLGEGSNVLLGQRIPGLVLVMANSGRTLLEDDGRCVRVRVAAGENWDAFVRWAHEQGYHGLENLVLIPGSVGAAPVQNIGAYGVEVASFIDAVHAVHSQSGEQRSFTRAECAFGYRDSMFKREAERPWIITSVDFNLDRQASPVIDYPALKAVLPESPVSHRQVMEAVQTVRQSKLPDPTQIPNVGSFFKNPVVARDQARSLAIRWPALPQYPVSEQWVKLSAAWMIDHQGWRGYRGEGVSVYDKHALILTSTPGGTRTEVLALADDICADVAATFGVTLAMEPDCLGTDDWIAS